MIQAIKLFRLFRKRNLVIHPEKSHFVPIQLATYFGFIINSEKMIVNLSDYTKQKLYEKGNFLTLNIELKIKNMDSFIGSLTYTEAATGGVLSEKCF